MPLMERPAPASSSIFLLVASAIGGREIQPAAAAVVQEIARHRGGDTTAVMCYPVKPEPVPAPAPSP